MGMRGARHFVETEHQERMRRRVAALWAEGFTMSEIARRLGVTKNVVSGLRWRMGLPNRPNPVRQDPGKRKRTKRPGGRPLPAAAQTLPPLDPPLPRVAAVTPPPPADDPPLPAAVLSAAVRKPKPPRKPRPPRVRVADQPSCLPHPAPLTAPSSPAMRTSSSPAMRTSSSPAMRTSTTCLWPLNDGENKRWLFCEDPRAEGAVYCDAHCARAYTGRERRVEPAYA
jgi:GcrA cell cycle regulator